MEYAFTAELSGPNGFPSFEIELIAEYDYTPAEMETRIDPGVEEAVEIHNIKCNAVNPSELDLSVCATFNIVSDWSQLEYDILQEAHDMMEDGCS